MNRKSFFVVTLFACTFPLLTNAQVNMPTWVQTQIETETATMPTIIVPPTSSPTATSSIIAPVPLVGSTGTIVSPAIPDPKKVGTSMMRTFVIGTSATASTTATGTKTVQKTTDSKIHVNGTTLEGIQSSFSFVLDETKRTLLEQFVFSMSSLQDNAVYRTNMLLQKLETLLTTAKTLIEKKTLTNPESASSFQSVLQDAETAIAYGKTLAEKQKTKMYEISVSQDELLTTDIKDTKDSFKKDIKKLQDAVVNAKVAVRAVFELLRTVQ